MRRSYRNALLIIFVLFIIGSISYYLSIKKSTFQKEERYAVVLTNGQIYFGSLIRDKDTYILRDAFYPQSNDSLRADANKKKITLSHVGDEIYGPQSIVYINRDQIMYYEKLRKESKVNEAVEKYLTEKSDGIASPTPSTSPSP
jgi:hypothetical protein